MLRVIGKGAFLRFFGISDWMVWALPALLRARDQRALAHFIVKVLALPIVGGLLIVDYIFLCPESAFAFLTLVALLLWYGRRRCNAKALR